MVIEGGLLHQPWKVLAVLMGMALVAGSANALNMYADKDIDALMARTRAKRPIPMGSLTPQTSLIFGLITGVVSLVLLWSVSNFLTAALGFATIFYYVVIYTLWLKRRTPYNIVIGGVAGATAPLMGWAATQGEIGWAAWLLFLIIFLWTPPHFWALALVVKEDYRKANVPMLPVVAGDVRTRWEIVIYTLILIPVTFAPVLVREGGMIYLIGGGALSLLYLYKTWVMMKNPTNRNCMVLFGVSILYLMGLFSFLLAGALLHEGVTTPAVLASLK